MKHDKVALETKFRTLNRSLADLAGQRVTEEFITVIHKPGWTTPAEFALVDAMADSLQRQVETTSVHFKQLIEIASGIGQK
jgi:hypothetical protein